MLLFIFLRLATGATWRSAVTAAVFAVHPLRVESVAWVTEGKDVLCGFFGFLTLIAYVPYARRPTWRKYAAVLALFTMCLLSKSMLVTLPCLMLLLDFWPLERLRWPGTNPREGLAQPLASEHHAWSFVQLALEKLPLLVPAAAIGIVTLMGQSHIGGVQDMGEVSLLARLANASVSYLRYIGKMFWFKDLAAMYPFRPVSLGLAVPAMAAVLLITLPVLWQARRRPWLAVGWLWYLGTLVPMIGLVAVGGLAWATRFSYFPTIGLLIMAFWAVPDPGPSPRLKLAYGGGFLAILLVLCAATQRQIGFWKNSVILWKHDLQILPDDPFALSTLGMTYANAGMALQHRGDVAGAIDQWRQALALNPYLIQLYARLADALLSQGKVPEAIEVYRQALQVRADNVDANIGLARLLLQGNQPDQAAAYSRRALAADPRSAKARVSLGSAFCGSGAIEEGMAQVAEAIRLDPQSAEAHAALGTVYLGRGNAADAARHFAEAVRIDPDCVRCHNNLGVA